MDLEVFLRYRVGTVDDLQAVINAATGQKLRLVGEWQFDRRLEHLDRRLTDSGLLETHPGVVLEDHPPSGAGSGKSTVLSSINPINPPYLHAEFPEWKCQS